MSSAPHKKLKVATNRLPITDQVFETMKTQDLNDPVGKQYLPSSAEKNITLKESADPIGDDVYSPVKGIVHRYPDRALLKITDTCAVYCRFCFRKEMVGKGDGVLNKQELDNALNYIKSTPQIKEIILTGGDPLTLSNRRLEGLLKELETIDHLDIIRFHTRAPIVNPKRIDEGFLKIINQSKKALYMVLHVNHAQEINKSVTDMIARLVETKITLLSQSVLLKNINDTVNDLENLFRTLVKNNVKPYYLHHPDLAKGTGHFRVSIKHGQKLMKSLRGRISGLCLPTYVLDIPNGRGKVPISECYIEALGNDEYTVEDYQGKQHPYTDDKIKND